MKIGIIGLPQTGKKTLYGLFTGNAVTVTAHENNRIADGIAEIRDARFEELVRLYGPRKTSKARIHLQLFPRLDPEGLKDAMIVQEMGKLDVLCHVVRCFEDDAVYHIRGSVDPERDVRWLNTELILQDLLFIEKRLERIGKGKKNEADVRREEELLLRLKTHLEMDKPLRLLDMTQEDVRLLSGHPLLSMKKMIVVLNVSEDELKKGDIVRRMAAAFKSDGCAVMQISAGLESEIGNLESEEEREAFMVDAGIYEPALEILSKLCMESLGLISFFTVGSDEVKQWLVREGSMAPEAGGVIHTDIQKGFIRAEVIKFPDLQIFHDEEGIKKAGRLYVMGRDYPIEDGDILCFRFNV